MLHEMVTGKRPFERGSRADMISAILRDEPEPRPSEIGEGFGPVIDHCLKKNSADRFQDCGQVHAALENLRSTRSKGTESSKKSVVKPAGSRARRRQIRSLAVLPLENHSADPEQEYFAEGMTESILTDLAQIGGLRVVSRTSVMRYKGTRKPLPRHRA